MHLEHGGDMIDLLSAAIHDLVLLYYPENTMSTIPASRVRDRKLMRGKNKKQP